MKGARSPARSSQVAGAADATYRASTPHLFAGAEPLYLLAGRRRASRRLVLAATVEILAAGLTVCTIGLLAFWIGTGLRIGR